MASTGQHVGRQKDALVEDESQSAARAHARAIARLARPQKARGGHDTGDGDACPIDPSHGRMLFMTGTVTQYCPHQSHDGVWKVGERSDPTPAFWPKGTNALAQAVSEYHRPTAGEAARTLPDLDIDLGGL